MKRKIIIADTAGVCFGEFCKLGIQGKETTGLPQELQLLRIS